LGNLDRNIPMLTIMGNAIGALGAWGLTAASNLFALSASLAQISGAALALPGIFAGLAIGIGATVAVFRDWSKVMADINERFGDLRNDMSDRFWAKRSEEHTSELQSRENLVCRLL